MSIPSHALDAEKFTKMNGNYLVYSIFTAKMLTCLSVLQKENTGRAISLLIYGSSYLPFLQLWILPEKGKNIRNRETKKSLPPNIMILKLKAEYSGSS